MASTFKTLFVMAPCRRLQFNISDMFPVPRLGIGYLSAYLKAHGYPETYTRDIIAEREWVPDLVEYCKQHGAPDLLGISVTLLSIREAFEIARGIKEHFPDIRIIVGGPGIGFSAAAMFRHTDAVDFFCRGEGEACMLHLVKALESGDSEFGQVPRLMWQNGAGEVIENAPGTFRDLNDGILCDYEAQPMHKFRMHPPLGVFPPATIFESTRGCSYPCEFCCLSMPVRYMSPENVEKEIRRLIDLYGVKEIHFVDPTFPLFRKRTEEILARIKPLGIRWSCKSRVDRIDDALAAKMADAGCYLIAFGVESGDDLTLEALQKKTQADIALETFKICRKYKIRTTAYLMVGNPGETEDSIDRGIQFVRKLKPDYILYDVLMADPANPLTRQKIEDGLFTDQDLEKHYMTDEPSWLDAWTVAGHSQEVARTWIKKAAGDFYVNPKYFYQRIRDLRSIQDAVNLGYGGSAFFKDFFGLGRLWNFDKHP